MDLRMIDESQKHRETGRGPLHEGECEHCIERTTQATESKKSAL